MKFNWNYPTTVWVGKNRTHDLSIACENLKIDKPLFVTDKDLINLPFILNIISKNSKVEKTIFDISKDLESYQQNNKRRDDLSLFGFSIA